MIRSPNGQQGANGTDGTNGVSPTVTQLPPRDPNCPTGGAAITDAAGQVAYVCSGASGADGQPFSGTFTSPNGLYSITVADSGVILSGPSDSGITVAGGDLTVRSQNATVRTDGSFDLRSGTSAQLNASIQLGLRGSTIAINGSSGCSPAVRTTDAVMATDPQTGFPAVEALSPGSSTVCIG